MHKTEVKKKKERKLKKVVNLRREEVVKRSRKGSGVAGREEMVGFRAKVRDVHEGGMEFSGVVRDKKEQSRQG